MNGINLDLKMQKKLIAILALIITILLCMLFKVQTADAATTKITIPKGYSKNLIIKSHYHTISKNQKKKLQKLASRGIHQNDNFKGTEREKNLQIDTKHLTTSQKNELTKYSLDVINSIRKQYHDKKWKKTKAAQKFADLIASNYTKNNTSCWDPDHDVYAIEKAAYKCGLNSTIGQVYEDMGGLAINSNNLTSKRTMYDAKRQIYYNVEQMIFGGFDLNAFKYQELSHYTEWDHAYDLVANKNSKEYGFSFSFLKNDPAKVSTHFIGVDKKYIINTKKYRS